MTQEQGFPASLLLRRVKTDQWGAWGYAPRNKPIEAELEALKQWFVDRNLEEQAIERAFNHGWSDVDIDKDPWMERAVLELLREEFINEGAKP